MYTSTLTPSIMLDSGTDYVTFNPKKAKSIFDVIEKKLCEFEMVRNLINANLTISHHQKYTYVPSKDMTYLHTPICYEDYITYTNNTTYTTYTNNITHNYYASSETTQKD